MSLNIGDHAVIAPDYRRPGDVGVVYKIEKVPRTSRERNYVGKPVLGGRGMRAPLECWLKYDGTLPDVTTAPVIPPTGAVVRSSIASITGPCVVLGMARDKPHHVKLTQLGGMDGRYWRAVPASTLTVIDPTTIVVP